MTAPNFRSLDKASSVPSSVERAGAGGGIKGNRCAFLKCLIKNDARKRSLRREREQDLPTLHTAMADGMSAPLQTQINESRDWER